MNKALILLFMAGSCCWLSCRSSRTTATATSTHTLEGDWELQALPAQAQPLRKLFRDKKPFIRFDLAGQRISGHAGCNNFSGPLTLSAHRLELKGPLMMTKMFCEGQAEQVFVETLQQVSSYNITESNSLELNKGNQVLMRFKRR